MSVLFLSIAVLFEAMSDAFLLMLLAFVVIDVLFAAIADALFLMAALFSPTFMFVAYSCEPLTASLLSADSVPAFTFASVVPPLPSNVAFEWSASLA